MLGGLVFGNPGGAILQWLVQVPLSGAQARYACGLILISLACGRMKIMGPATFSSGMTHINLYIILILASYIPPSRCRANLCQFVGANAFGHHFQCHFGADVAHLFPAG